MALEAKGPVEDPVNGPLENTMEDARERCPGRS